MYTSSLQYRCSFDVMENTQYKANWYINGTFQVQMGPSSDLDDLVFKENYLTTLKHGYEVTCGIFPAAENDSTEAVSDAYYAGWKIQNENIILSKSGVATVTIEQTIPLGCSYREDDAGNCLETLSFEDVVNKADDCSGRIEVKSYDDPSKPLIEIKKLRKGEVWAKKEYRALFSTLDNNYDDRTDFDLLLLLTNNSIGYIGEIHIVGAVHVVIVDIKRHWNKRCYSHVDPHMKTVDGIHYEAQKEGDYMLFLNEKYQTEIQTSARYCSPGNTRAVCACGIAIAVGADVLIINICHDRPFKFDLSCVDGGNIDIIFIHDYRYLVRTPIGTMIEILLWGHVMNIDVYMSPKDFGNVAGLCGNFDGDRSNDLEHRDGTISYDNNRSYRFADSWRLTDEENLFKNPNRKLDHWNRNNFGKTCTSPNSITTKKCKLRNRQRQIRSISEPSETKMNKQYRILSSRKKRNTIILTEDEAFQLCNHSIYTTPAVQEFPDHLAEEDPDIVVEQCVYDLTQGNDTAWIDAHVSVLNNAVDTILRMSPGFVANNTEKVNSFRIETCLNNCSGNGFCAITGLCECSGTFKGPACSIDIRIPPVVFEIEGDGVCTVTDEDDCTCFQIRTDNIFDGFMCNITQFKVYSNGSRVEGSVSTDLGYYEDIFTGECCVPVMIKNSSSVLNDKTDKLFVIMYEISISNDGANYGDVNPVYIYDTKCIERVEINDAVTFKLKDSFCFIDAVCIAQNLDNGTCFICNPANDPYGWTKDDCKDSGTEIGTGIIVGIVIGSTLFVVLISVLIYIFACKVLKKHSSSIGVQQKAMVPTHNLQSKMPHQKQSAKIQISARPNIEQNIMIGTAHHMNQITEMLHVEKGASAQETDVFYTPIDKYETDDLERKVATPSESKLKRDISFINIELE
ncbi:uncharacterized protein LOC132755828 [Ruditapes philippinarum]|uniref:uncharacterized protein LOC132755828 n=1 Tax=Ruditapes philippinarum TaxID=129788 RepID=UPI00295A79D7|nr:uncharacterized protein LOC132755828 [Ruditapes philippinarum]